MAVSSWNTHGQSQNLADAVGIMIYSSVQSLQWIPQYTTTACTQYWCALCNSAKVGQPCTSVPTGSILAGLGGDANQSDVNTVCTHLESGENGSAPIGGYMVWYASADNGFQYSGGNNDARVHNVNWACKQAQEEQFLE